MSIQVYNDARSDDISDQGLTVNVQEEVSHSAVVVERNNIETDDIPILIGQIDVEDVKSSKSNHIAFSSDVHTVELLDNLNSDNTHSLFQNQNEDEGTNQQANSFTPVDEIVTNPVPNNLLEDKETADLSRSNTVEEANFGHEV